MVFGGMQKLTLLDFPGRVAATLFTKGCNFRCPFCHNAYLVEIDGKEESVTSDYILDYLKKRKGILDAVCITGGEPLLHNSLAEFIESVKALGYAVKLDTNGSLPQRLKELCSLGLVDYVAMDVKNTLPKYPVTSGCMDMDVSKIEESIDFLLNGTVDYELRTTVCKELHTPQDIEEIAKRIQGAKRYFIQNFVDSGNILCGNMSPWDKEDLKYAEFLAQKYVETASIRGTD